MAQLPPTLYSEGAVAFDSRPYLAFTQQYLARKQAKDDALDNYFRDFGKNLTPAGMRNQDIPVFTAKNNEWRQFYIQNKDRITNPRLDGGKAYSEYMSRYQDQLQTVQQSKNAAEITKAIGQIRADPKKAELLTDESLNNMAYHDKPLNDPEHKTFDLNALTYKPPPFDAKMREGFYKSVTTGLTPSKMAGQPTSIGDFKLKVPYYNQYSPEDLQAIGNRAMAFADSDRSIKSYANNELMPSVLKDQGRYDELNNIFKRVYGEDAKTGADLFAAQTIMDLNRKSVEEKIEEDSFGRQKAMEAIRFKHQKELKKVDQEAADGWIVNFWNSRITTAKSGEPTTLPDPESPVQMNIAYEIKPDAVMMKGLARNGQEPERVYVTADNKIMPIFYQYKEDYDSKTGKKIGTSVKTDTNGNPVIDKDYSKPMDLDQAYLSLGYKGQTKKQLEGTMQGTYQGKTSERKYNVSGKTYSHAQLNKMGYSDEEINQAIQQGIIK